MIIEIKKFGDILISRPAGKEAFLAAKAYTFKSFNDGEEIVLDFLNVKVLAPSWIDEFINGIVILYPKSKINFINTNNESVKASLEIIKAA